MTKTLISSDKQEVTSALTRHSASSASDQPDRPQAAGRRDGRWRYSRVISDAVAQVEAGATMLDVNAGIPMADEPAILAESIKLVQDTVDVPLAIDSSIVAALEAGLSVYKGKPLVNSVTGEEERLEVVLPLVKKYNAAVVAISNDETGISEDRMSATMSRRRSSSAPRITASARGCGRRPADHAGRRDQSCRPVGA